MSRVAVFLFCALAIGLLATMAEEDASLSDSLPAESAAPDADDLTYKMPASAGDVYRNMTGSRE